MNYIGDTDKCTTIAYNKMKMALIQQAVNYNKLSFC